MTQALNKVINAVSAPERPVHLLQIDHTSFAEAFRIVNDRQDLTSNGHLYVAAGFNLVRPNQPDSGAPRASIQVDNVDKALVAAIDAAKGLPGATCTISQVLRSAPNTVEWSTELDLSNISVTTSTIVANLAYDDVFNQPSFVWTYRSDTAPGLF